MAAGSEIVTGSPPGLTGQMSEHPDVLRRVLGATCSMIHSAPSAPALVASQVRPNFKLVVDEGVTGYIDDCRVDHTAREV